MSHNDEQLRMDRKLRLYSLHGISLAHAIRHQTAQHSIAHVLHEAGFVIPLLAWRRGGGTGCVGTWARVGIDSKQQQQQQQQPPAPDSLPCLGWLGRA
jgi:hypothetical protein